MQIVPSATLVTCTMLLKTHSHIHDQRRLIRDMIYSTAFHDLWSLINNDVARVCEISVHLTQKSQLLSFACVWETTVVVGPSLADV